MLEMLSGVATMYLAETLQEWKVDYVGLYEVTVTNTVVRFVAHKLIAGEINAG